MISPIFLRTLGELACNNVYDTSQHQKTELDVLQNLGVAQCSLFVACIITNGSQDSPDEVMSEVDTFCQSISINLPDTVPMVSYKYVDHWSFRFREQFDFLFISVI